VGLDGGTGEAIRIDAIIHLHDIFYLFFIYILMGFSWDMVWDFHSFNGFQIHTIAVAESDNNNNSSKLSTACSEIHGTQSYPDSSDNTSSTLCFAAIHIAAQPQYSCLRATPHRCTISRTDPRLADVVRQGPVA
jgi:hypothetical protein